ncbi:GIY-YIG nuclease family protein [Segetibacter sp. 3557_3]|uniref:GIY-YIG nuclease family protein n=1 Tax=Segetibacter sp. 3557_3 TaxID=2547429 RepID=UPI0010589508|nr:GIY-YIG nuclease family protein [Segetibacter sp. 3557_3]TDH29241.1 GIY-YIG nuclease family protein [Segetibacter sp. 3557_3]
MSFYVYIIQSQKDLSYYKGFTEDPGLRLERHNRGESTYTRKEVPWKLVYLEIRPTKKDALIREKVVKKYSHEQILQLINSSPNLAGSVKISVVWGTIE